MNAINEHMHLGNSCHLIRKNYWQRTNVQPKTYKIEIKRRFNNEIYYAFI